MQEAIKILEDKLNSEIINREGFRKSSRRKGLFQEFFLRWAKDSTKTIRSIKKALKVLNEKGLKLINPFF